MRIIAGTLKGRRLQAPPPGDRAVRPTSDRAREALFSLLQKYPSGAFLDLFGGTGAVAVEAFSRGYAPVTCLERERGAYALVEANVRGTGVCCRRQDVRKLAPGAFAALAVAFADPPYEETLALWARMAGLARTWMAPDGILVWETDARTELPPDPAWELVDQRTYGNVRFHLLAPAGEPPIA